MVWGEEASGVRRPERPKHPFCLEPEALKDAIRRAWVRPARAPEPDLETADAWIALASADGWPGPSLELQADLDESPSLPRSWAFWRVSALSLEEPSTLLKHLSPKDIADPRVIRIGHDLRFWAQLLAALQNAVRHHEYLPSIRATAPANSSVPERRRKPRIELEAGWELTRSAVDRIAPPFAKAMPDACRALRGDAPASSGSEPRSASARSLVEHFLQVQLQAIVGRAMIGQKVRTQFRRTFPGHALPGSTKYLDLPPLDEATWEHWWQWRERIQRSSREADQRICFRLEEAPGDAPDDWCLEWLLTSRRDPSLLVPLAKFWARSRSKRTSRMVRDVLLQLGQAAQLYHRLWEGMDSAAPARVRLTRDEALAFMKFHAPVLQGAGFRVIVPAWWTSEGLRRLRVRLSPQRAAPGTLAAESTGLLGLNALLRFKSEVLMDGTPLTREEWESVVRGKQGLVRLRGQWMELQPGEVKRLEEFWNKGAELLSMTVQETLKMAASTDGPEILHDGEAGQVLAGLAGPGALEQLEQPGLLQGRLRPYQLRGYSWLAYLESLGLGACLADDMGLGKTVQVIATVLQDRDSNPGGGPTLLVAPTSVLGNWQREVRRFAPTLVTYLHHGPKRAKTLQPFKRSVAGSDIVVSSFAVARLDIAVLTKIRWHRLVVDECQNAKNPSAAVTKALRRIRAERRIAMTGTPVENRLMDLWSLFSVINPGYLGTMTAFRKNFERRIARDRDAGVMHQLRGMVQPFILRRMKTDKAIISDLPEKVEQNACCNLTREQASLYEAVVRDVEEQLKEGPRDGVRRTGLVLSTLTRLKQICNHPAQFLQDGSKFSEARSHKLARVCEMLEEIEAEGESALVFTQFRTVGKELEALFRRRFGGAVYFLHGGTPRARREYMVDEFQNPHSERGIFLLSLKAGGTGITLTRANHVIHFDRWWNPAVENQATDRAHRIGQKKRVMVHKMLTIGTLEERINEVIESKRELAEEIVGSGESWLSELDNDSFRRLISLDRDDAVVG